MKVELRDNQPEIVESIINAFRSGTKVVVLNAPTGVGKSIINMISAQSMGTAYTTTPLRTLVDQYKDTVLKFEEDELGWVVMGRGGYPCPHLIHNENVRFDRLPPEEKNKEYVQKGHEYRIRNLTADGAPCSDESSKYYVGEGHGEFGNKKQYVKQCPFRKQCPYYQDKDKAMVSQNAIATFDYFMYGIYSQLEKNIENSDGNSWEIRDTLVIDEAHNLPNKLVDFFTITVSERTLPGFNVQQLVKNIDELKKTMKPGEKFSVKVSEAFQSMLIDYMNLQEQEKLHLESMAEESDENDLADVDYQGRRMPLEEAIQKHRKFMYKLKFIKTSINSDVEFVYNSDDSGIYLKPYSAKHYVKPLWEMFDHILLSSATFFDVESYLQDLGLSEYKWKLMDVPSSFDPEKGPIIREGNLYLSRKNFDSTIGKVVEKVDEILDRHKNERGMVHCFSSPYRKAIMEQSKNMERLVTHDSFNRNEVLREFTSNVDKNDNKVLVSVNMGEGVDLKDDLARFQIIVKAPLLPFGDPWIALHKERSERWYKSQTIMQIMQMAGRVVRSKDDYGITYIIDNNGWRLLEENRKYLPKWFIDRMDAGEIERKKQLDKELSDLMNF